MCVFVVRSFLLHILLNGTIEMVLSFRITPRARRLMPQCKTACSIAPEMD